MKISNFEEYNEFRRGKRRWAEPEFAFPRDGTSTCGLCKGKFIASDFIFLLCRCCLQDKIVIDKSKAYTDVVYGLYSMNDELLYVGVTNNPMYRAHNHMLTKNFKYLQVIAYFTDRQAADDYEKYSISEIRPPLNRLIDKDWSEVPKNWDRSAFGKVAAKIRTKKPKNAKTIRPNCDICNQRVGEKNEVVYLGEIVHYNCLPSVKEHRETLVEAERQTRKESKKREFASVRRENERHKRRSQIADIVMICAVCDVKVKARNALYIKDKSDNKGVIHKVCVSKKRRLDTPPYEC